MKLFYILLKKAKSAFQTTSNRKPPLDVARQSLHSSVCPSPLNQGKERQLLDERQTRMDSFLNIRLQFSFYPQTTATQVNKSNILFSGFMLIFMSGTQLLA